MKRYGDRSVTLGEATVHYRVTGEQGPAVVMLHGAGGILVNGAVAAGLGADFRVYEPSLPGCDTSPPEGTTTLYDQADVIASFVRAVADPPAHIVGHSYGGRVAAWVAIRHPDVVRRLVLSAPATLETASARPAPGPGAPYAPPKALFGDAPVPFDAEELQRIGRNAACSFSFFRQSPDRETTLRRLAEIAAPVLLLWAGADQVLAAENGPQTFAAAIPGLRVHVIEGAPHLITVLATDEYVAQVRAFLLEDGAAT
jgi:pimeloyl-ACP methyl ester carboxylesterase